MTRARISDCPLARTVEVIDRWWTLEILHVVLGGHTRFSAIRRDLETPADVLADRIAALRAKGLLEVDDTADDTAEPGDPTYRATDLGRSLRPLILVMAAFGNHRLAPEDRSVVLVDEETGREVDPVVVDRATGRRVDTAGFVFARGPKASEQVAARYPEPRAGG
ncbi:winged helix-turn-helix transcriptional regulator [Streptomyces sp. SP18BB07]|uniref:winged helix-turn-helix transcriptional regulator n=1 Tax=Streptomyces sp. SP18BB07 TaxID=3002522 RepID=UPI002E7A4F52|nr:helix-turn-helix domain-containing protein [Streptomyces sp. SP18BB07]MEE1760790.1 helix-turn-helix domain-containing protein [Streptomyces sp. SP18BB07]